MLKVNTNSDIKISLWQNTAVALKFESNKPHLHLLSRPIETPFNVQKFAKSGVPYYHIFYITDGIYLL